MLIHIGYHKTGTTWFQQHLFQNPTLGFVSPFSRRDINRYLVDPHDLDFDSDTCKKIFQPALLKAQNQDLLPVLSHENLVGNPHSGGYNSKNIADRLISVFPEAKILIVIREQKSVILSTYKQYVKAGGTSSARDYLQPPTAPRRDIGRIPLFAWSHFEYHRLISYYLKLLGYSRLLVLPYELFGNNPAHFAKKILRFCDLESDTKILEALPYSIDENKSLSAMTTSLKRLLNPIIGTQNSLNPRVLFSAPKNNPKLKLYSQKLDTLTPSIIKHPFEKRLNATIATLVGDRYRHSNDLIAKTLNMDLNRYGYDVSLQSLKSTTQDNVNLTFNIIYTSGVVKYLGLFVFSLLKWTDCSFRLVANDCRPEEIALLQLLCRENPRLELVTLPFAQRVGHGQALNYLQAQESSAHFCFMDSDILATGNFMNDFMPYLDHHVGLFSGTALWCKAKEQILPEDFPRIAGRHHQTKTGECLGSSFFAIYDNQALTQLMKETGLTFIRYYWPKIPRSHQQQLINMGFKKQIYDTGKLLNLWLLTQGDKILFKESALLQHLGSVSARLFQPNVLEQDIERLQLKKLSNGMPQQHARQLVALHKRKLASALYFTQLLQSLFNNQSQPTIPSEIESPEIREKIIHATAAIVATYEEFGEKYLNMWATVPASADP